MGGGGGSSSNTTQNDVEVNTYTKVQNDILIDLVPLGEILADSQENSAQIYSDGQTISANTNKEAQAIALINSELDRKAKQKTLNKLDGYLEHAKNGLFISAVVAGLLYYTKK